jgi:hypothetical protein
MERRQPVPGVGVGFAGIARPLAVLVLLGAGLLVACDGNEDGGATPSATVAAEPTATAAREPPTTPAVEGARPQHALARQPHGLVLDVTTETFTPLLPPLPDDEDAFYFAPSFFPVFTPDGAHVWVSERSTFESQRYDLDGSVNDEVPGWLLDESAPGTLAYLRQTPEGWALTVARGDEVMERDEIPPRGHIDLSPDGSKVAYWAEDVDETVAVEVAEVATGEVLAHASRVGLCQCDGGAGFEWSPSGRYLAFGDVRSPLGDDTDPEAGTYALDTVTGERIRLAGNEGRPGVWLEDDRYLGERDGSVAILDLPSGEVERQIAPVDPRGSFWVTGDVVAVPERDARGLIRTTRIYDLASGTLVSEWPGDAHPSVVEGGMAVEQRTDANSVVLHHPALREPFEVRGWVLPSPDGEHFAATNGVTVRIYRIVDGEPVEVGVYDNAEHERWGVNVTPVEWNAEGTDLLISIGFGL